MSKLPVPEAKRLSELEDVIEHGVTTFVEVGAALAEIRDSKLYRASHDTFEAYCKERWGMSKPRAYQLIEAATTVETVSTIVDLPLPQNEAQVRPLSRLKPEQQREAWQEAVKTAPDGKVTAAHVERTVRAREPEHDAPTSETMHRHYRRPVDGRITVLIEAAQKMNGITDDQLSAVQTNDLMIDGLQLAVTQIKRIISLHLARGA